MSYVSPFGTMYRSRTIVTAAMSVFAAFFFGQAARADEASKVTNIKPDAALAAMVPKVYRDRGTLTVGANPDVAPVKFVDDDGNITGFAPDLLSAAVNVLNLKIEISQSSFDALIPGMSAGRFDVLLSISDFTSRQKVVTFIDYLNVGETIVASPERHLSLKSLDDMCGLQVALSRGSATVEEAARVSERCIKNGKKPLVVATYPAGTALLSLSTGSSDVAWVDSPVGYYNANKFPAKYQVVYFSPLAPYAIGFSADEKGKQLAAAVQQALLKLQKDGIYDMLLKKWALNPKDGKPLFPINGARL